MPYFRNSNALYAVLRTTFTRLAHASPEQLNGLHGLTAPRLVLQLSTTAPEGEVTLNGKEKQIQIAYGKYGQRVDLKVELAADTLHRILLDELSIKTAWQAKQIRATGPIWRLGVLTDLVKGARQFYPAVIKEYEAALAGAPPATARQREKRVPQANKRPG